MKSYIIAIFGIIILALVGVLGDFFIKLASQNQSFFNKWFYLGLFVYAITAFGWVFAMKSIKLSTLGVFYSLSTAIFLFLLGTIYFKEKFNNYELIGFFLGLISLFLLTHFR